MRSIQAIPCLGAAFVIVVVITLCVRKVWTPSRHTDEREDRRAAEEERLSSIQQRLSRLEESLRGIKRACSLESAKHWKEVVEGAADKVQGRIHALEESV